MINLKEKLRRIESLLILATLVWCGLLFGGITFPMELITIKIVFGILWLILSIIGIYWIIKMWFWKKSLSKLEHSETLGPLFEVLANFPFLEKTFDLNEILLRKLTEDLYFQEDKLTQSQLILLKEIKDYLDKYQFNYWISTEFFTHLFIRSNESTPKIIVEPNQHKSEAISILLEGFKKEKDKIYPLLCETIINSNSHEVDIPDEFVYTFEFKKGKDKVKLSFL